MKAKLLIAAFLLMFAATMPVIAQGNGNGGGNSARSEDDGTNESEDDASTNSAAENGKSGNSGNSNGNSNNGGGNGVGTNDKSSASDAVTVVPEEDLLAIVKAGQAVSLASLLPNVEERTGGEIIDAQLVRTERSLIYVVKVMTPEGRVGTEYYNARSGTHIEAQ